MLDLAIKREELRYGTQIRMGEESLIAGLASQVETKNTLAIGLLGPFQGPTTTLVGCFYSVAGLVAYRGQRQQECSRCGRLDCTCEKKQTDAEFNDSTPDSLWVATLIKV